MGDYGHLLIDHAPMLMRRFLSMTKYSQQGFEASHKDQRQLWLKSSNHDCNGEASSIEQILKHFYSEKTLFLRYCFREALRVVQGHHGKKNNYDFFFRGCGWKKKKICWTKEDILWIKIIDQLMTSTFGDDFLKYE
ncbi:hypothetical protein AC249_AIPGENE4420 [Exaiptasia diaphana]|nr:hypothetical protein AC249_AIPGENE4420 [Exaiptasia diaphana]